MTKTMVVMVMRVMMIIIMTLMVITNDNSSHTQRAS
jgi:hypothetical protein